MAGFRLQDGSCGCPPTETPAANFRNSFRFDDAGCLYIDGCFTNFTFLGAARHDISTPGILGSGDIPLNTAEDIVSGDGVTAGVYTTLEVTNDSNCDMGYLLGYDLNADLDVKGTSLAKWILSGRWNGANVDVISCSSVRTGSSAYCRLFSGNAANPHDPAIEVGSPASLTLAPGASATVGARLFLQYAEGAPDGVDQVRSSGSSVRVYGYVL